jgi:hypothetical protein
LILRNNTTNDRLEINSVIQNNTTASGLTKSGPGQTIAPPERPRSLIIGDARAHGATGRAAVSQSRRVAEAHEKWHDSGSLMERVGPGVWQSVQTGSSGWGGQRRRVNGRQSER